MRSASTIPRDENPGPASLRPPAPPPPSTFHVRLRTEQDRADRHGRPLGIVSFIGDGGAEGESMTLVQDIARRRLRATDWVGPVQDGSVGLLLPFTSREETERLATEIMSHGRARGARMRAEVQAHRPRTEAGRARRRPNLEPLLERRAEESPDVRWEPRGVPLLLARPLPRGKRALDVGLALVGLALALPLMGLIALAILVTSGRPILFRQWRTGLGFRRFQILKFRTMRTRSSEGWEDVQHLNEYKDGAPLFKSDHDPRVFSLGRFLRKTSLDELPQLLNVLKGDMTLIGPRALSPEPGQYKHWQLRRFDVTPGIACSWQAERRKDTDFKAWMRSDLHYLDHDHSPLGDMRVLLRALWAVVLCRGGR
jgi:lipopolysaccharide/colanic/teichoic acid biosynthesis glycosyltransferase